LAQDAMDVMASPDERRSLADGEVVWSWHPDADAKLARGKLSQATVARKPGHRGEHEGNR
jgi:hypothetical protein